MTERRDFELTDIKRRLSSVIVYGKISQVDYKKGRYRVKAGEIESDWIPDGQGRSGKTRTYEPRDIGEQVVIVSPSGDLSQGIIISSAQTETTQGGDEGNVHRTLYPDGTSVEYDDEKNTYTMNIKTGGKFYLSIAKGASIGGDGGKLVLNAPEGILFNSDGDLTLEAKGGVHIKSNSGVNIETGGGIVTNSSTLQHNGKNVGHTHTHTGVYPGGGVTGVPS